MPRPYVLIPITLLVSSAWAAPTTVDLVAREAFASDVDGNPIEFRPGEPIYTTINFDVVGAGKPRYFATIDAGFTKQTTPILTNGTDAPGQYRITWGPLPTPTLKPIPIKVSLVPASGFRERNRKNNTASFSMNPLALGTGIQVDSFRTLHGRTDVQGEFTGNWSNDSFRTVWIAHVPTTAQQLALNQTTQGPWEATIAPSALHEAWVGRLTENSAQFQIATAYSVQSGIVRANRNALMAVAQGDYAQLPDDIGRYLLPETLIQSDHSSLQSFASKAVRKAQATTPYEVAESLYLATIRHASYRFDPNAMPSALGLLKSKRGDCGAFSALFVALCRTQGLPARTVTGIRAGQNNWHVWAEVYFPGHGWLPADPSDAETLDAKGTHPIYFGILPDQNQRITTAIGFDHHYGDEKVPILQTAWVRWTQPGTQLANLKITGLVEAEFLP